MPSYSISDGELAVIKNNMVRDKRENERLKDKLARVAKESKVVTIGEGLAGAGIVGYARGRLEDKATGAWNVPGTTVDIEMLTVLGLAGVALAGDALGLKKWTGHAANVVTGVGGHYFGQVMRKWAATGNFSLIAGSPRVGTLPQYDPTSYDPTQWSSPYADPVASALASSGV